jgi:hypothetical protein
MVFPFPGNWRSCVAGMFPSEVSTPHWTGSNSKAWSHRALASRPRSEGGVLSDTFASRNKDFVQSMRLAKYSAVYGSRYLR